MKLPASFCLSVGLVLPAMAAPRPITRRTITTSLLDELDLFAQYSAAAYCSANLDSTGSALACSAGNCPSVEAADTTILYDFNESSSFGDATGYLAVDNTNQLIILAFRGSSDLANWIANLDFPLIDVSSLCSGCEAHQGFWETWETVASALTSQVGSALETYSEYTFVITGHSLGGALAAIAATVFRDSGNTVELYNYGQPRIGNLDLATYITDQTSGSNYRVTHTDDIVPKLPPEALGYHHFSPEYWITSGDNVTVTDSDVDEVVGIDSTAGNDGTSGDSTSAHAWYFVDISAC